jgi:hypothetical protein
MKEETMEPIGNLAAALAAAHPLMLGRYWTNALGFSRYLVSDEGEVLSLVKKPRILKPIRMGNYRGLQIVGDDGRLAKKYLHRLVLEAYHGPAPAGAEGRHLDGNKANNHPRNLAWGTKLENEADRKRHGTTAKGERNPQARLTAERVEEMRALYAAGGWTFKRLGAAFCVTTMTAHRAVRRQTWN